MKTIENKKFDIVYGKGQDGSVINFDTKRFMILCLDNVWQGGINYKENRERTKIVEKIEKAKDKIELEDAEFTKLKECCESMKWATRNDNIDEFYKQLDEAI